MPSVVQKEISLLKVYQTASSRRDEVVFFALPLHSDSNLKDFHSELLTLSSSLFLRK